jgi:hypothetical protein
MIGPYLTAFAPKKQDDMDNLLYLGKVAYIMPIHGSIQKMPFKLNLR